MERLFGNFWFHVDGSHIHAYERIAAFHQVPLRIDPEEGLPHRLPIEIRLLLCERLIDQAKILEAQPARDSRMVNLETQLEQFPNWSKMAEPQKKYFRDMMSEGLNPNEENQVSSLETFTQCLALIMAEKAELDGKAQDAPGLSSVLGQEESEEANTENDQPPETERGKAQPEAPA